MIFYVFKYTAYFVMASYCIFALYLFSPYVPQNFDGVGSTIWLLYASFPIFFLSLGWLVYSIAKSNIVGCCISGLALTLLIIFIVKIWPFN
jgi:hypothetical protein